MDAMDFLESVKGEQTLPGSDSPHRADSGQGGALPASGRGCPR